MPILIFRDRFSGQMQFERWQFQLRESQREVGQSFPVSPATGLPPSLSLLMIGLIDRFDSG